MKKQKKFKNGKYEMKSHIELYFSWWLDELKREGFIKEWWYEEYTFPLAEQIKVPYKKQLKTKVKEEEEIILERASCTADFTIVWSEKAKNIFYLDRNEPLKGGVRDIPIRLSDPDKLISHIETKGNNESSTSSSISFPYKQKWVYQKYGAFIQKVKPFSYKVNKNILFQSTFYPAKVLETEVYKRNCKFGKQGESKIRHKTTTLKQFLKKHYEGNSI